MNRIDTSTSLAEISDFVLELAQPDGSTVRVCVSIGPQPISLAVFLRLLAQKGNIAWGGGSPTRSDVLASEARQRGLLMDIDDGGEYPSYGYEISDGMDDPFADSSNADAAEKTKQHTFKLKLRETLCDRCRRAGDPDPACHECALVLENAIRQGGRL